MDTTFISRATAHTNIALAKYWGKKDTQWNLPTTDSIGLTLDAFSTTTTVRFSESLPHDQVSIDGQLTDQPRVTKVLDLIRQQAKLPLFAEVTSTNQVPMAAGFASSASAFAALAAAGSRAAGLQLNEQELSTIARYGSGSAARSISGGLTRWYAGEDHATSLAETIMDPVIFDIKIIDLLIDVTPKEITSSQGMRLAQTSPQYANWLNESKIQTDKMIQAINARDVNTIGEIAESNALAMHALNRSAQTPFDYFSPATRQVLDEVKDLRQQGVLVYATIDAGPNIKLITTSEFVATLQKQFAAYQQIIASPGEGIRYDN